MKQKPAYLVAYVFKVPLSENLSQLGITLTLVLLVAALVYLITGWLWGKALSVIVGSGLFFFWLSTAWFPWLMIQRRFPIVDSDIQFPYRFLPVGIIALFLMLAVGISRLRQRVILRLFHWRIPWLYICD